MNNSSVFDCVVIPLKKIHNRAGNITIITSGKSVPFQIQRVYYLYDIPAGASRGGHSHRELFQLLISASGSYNVFLDDGENKKIVCLNRPDYGLLVYPGIWRELMEFSSGAICISLASDIFDESDYIREYSQFLEFRKHDPQVR
jgi:hypothetical protein